MFNAIFIAHPQTVGESYLEHQRSAWGFAMALLAASLMCFAHGLIPALFESAGSRRVAALHDARMAKRRRIVTKDAAESFAYAI